MATGDGADFASRLRVVLPRRWFADDATLLGTLLAGWGAQFADFWTLLGFVRQQTRIATATGAFLDLAAVDFLNGLPRRLNEPDAAYSVRFRREVLRPRLTRAAIVEVVQDLTGLAPVVFRPTYAADTGGYGVAMGYGTAGAYGSYALPFQAFVVAYRGTAAGGGTIAPNLGPLSGWGDSLGGYGAGDLCYGDGSAAIGGVTDDDIYAAVASVMPAGSVFWTAILNPPAPLAEWDAEPGWDVGSWAA